MIKDSKDGEETSANAKVLCGFEVCYNVTTSNLLGFSKGCGVPAIENKEELRCVMAGWSVEQSNLKDTPKIYQASEHM